MKPQMENSKLSVYLSKRPSSSYKYYSVNNQRSNKVSSTREAIREFTKKNLSIQKDPQKKLYFKIFKNNIHSYRQHDQSEKLFEECLQFKSTINKMNNEITLLKSELIKKDADIKKSNEMLKKNMTEACLNYDFINEKFKILEENTLIYNLKKEFNILKREYEKKDKETQEIKQTSKYIRLREFQIENQILSEEIRHLKSFNEELIDKIKLAEEIEKDFTNLREKYKNQSDLVEELQIEIKFLKNENEEKSNGKDNKNLNNRYEFNSEKIKEFSKQNVKIKEEISDKKNINLNMNMNRSQTLFALANPSAKKKFKIKNKAETTANFTILNTNNITNSNIIESNLISYTTPSNSNKIANENVCNNSFTNLMSLHQIKIYTFVILTILQHNGTEKLKFSEVF